MFWEVSCVNHDCRLLCLPVDFSCDGANEIVGVVHGFCDDSLLWLWDSCKLCFEFFLYGLMIFFPLFVVEYVVWVLPVVVELVWCFFDCFFVSYFVV